MANEKTTNILLVEDNPGDTRLIEIYVSEIETLSGHLFHAENLTQALEILGRAEIDIILLDLSLPDAEGLEAFLRLNQSAPHIPIVILTGREDGELGTRAVRLGAQDYLNKNSVNAALIGKSLRYAIERSEARRETERLHAELAQRQRMADMGQTMAGISHHVKNVLMRMTSSNHLIEKALEDGQYAQLDRLWPVFSRATDELHDYVLKMLDFSRNQELDPKPVDLNELAADLKDLCENDAKQRRLRLRLDLQSGVPPIRADRERLSDAVLNLIGNAMEACGETEGAEIVLSTRQVEGSPFVTLLVADNGPGIPDDIKTKIFEPYFSTKPKQGTGLGLALVQKIVLAHEGRIRMSSSPGRTVFEISLPVAADAERSAESDSGAETPGRESGDTSPVESSSAGLDTPPSAAPGSRG